MQKIEGDRLCVYVVVSFDGVETNYIAQSVNESEAQEACRKLRVSMPSFEFHVFAAHISLPPVSELNLNGEPWQQAGLLEGRVAVGKLLYDSPDDFYSCPFELIAREIQGRAK